MKVFTFAEALATDPKNVQSIKEARDSIEGIERFTNLVNLDVSSNPNVKEFGFLKKLTKLEGLYIQELELGEIPSEVGTLKKLNRLYVGKNSIASFSILKELPAVVALGLDQIGIRKIPSEVLAVENLKVLELRNNSITSLTSLKAMVNLESLYVGNNPIKKVPKELKKLKKLRSLDISGNGHLKDCEVVADLRGLELLYISSGYDIERFPVGMFKLTNLKRLYISVHLKSAADAVDGLAEHTLMNLEELTIDSSRLSSLPESVSDMKKLTHLTIKRNSELTNVDAIRDLPNLKFLNLERNQIETLGAGFSTLKKLEFLNLNFNRLVDVSGLKDLPLLRELHLFSKLEALPETLGTLTALENLQLSANEVTDVSFLTNLTNLNELYLAGCQFEVLPSSLGKTVKKLTVFRNGGDDSYLEDFKILEELEVSQTSFSLPIMRSIQALSIGGAEKGIDLKNIAAATSLQRLKIHRTNTLTALPSDLSKATQVRHFELEFFDELKDISALEPLENIETLKVQHCEKLATLRELGPKPKLTKLELYALPLTELDIVGNLEALQNLTITRVEKITSLPDELSTLPNLAKVHLHDVDELQDILVLERCKSLIDFQCTGDGPKRKSIAKVNTSIAARSGNGTDLKTSYATFMKSMYKTMSGKEDASHPYPFPLWFDTPEILLNAIKDFDWVGEHLYGKDGELKDILENPEHGLKPLAALDWGYEGCDMDVIDSYSQEFFLVDTESPLNPVLLWGHDSRPTEIYNSFDTFLANLRDFVTIDDDDVLESTVTQLQYTDNKSSKFWQVTVKGNTHVISYGKIGTNGQTKEKIFEDSEAANRAADKVIASKRKKGYVDRKPKT